MADLLESAWSALGGDPDLLALVALTGDSTGLLPSRLPVLPALSAAVGAATLAAAVLDAVRSGRDPLPVQIDVRHVAVAARSERYARGPGSAGAGFAPLSRFWRTADGWLRLHANYAWHRARALDVLGCDDSPEAVGATVQRWRGAELEEALADAGGVGSAVRSPEQWLAHPQGRTVAAQPLLSSAPQPGAGRPLGAGRAARGARVLDLTRVIAGPVATRTLAAWGADVLRLEAPGLPEDPETAVDTLPGKRSATLDLASAPGRERLERLLAEADVLVQGYRPGALARFGLAPEALADRHPHLSVVSLSAWGAGPWAERRGFDSLVQAATGIAVLEGNGSEPGALPTQALDHGTGYLAAAAAMLALAAVQRGEPPRSVRLSLASTARWLTGSATERQPERPLSPDGYLVELPGDVVVIGPPGIVGALRPAWTGTTELGADAAAFGH